MRRGQACTRCRAAMFVSANAVRHFLAARRGAPWPAGTQAWATGPGTAAALRERGVPADQVDAPAADAPASSIPKPCGTRSAAQVQPGWRVLLVRGAGEDGSIGRDWLARQPAAGRRRGRAGHRVPAPLPAVDAGPGRCGPRARPADGSVWLFSSSEAIANLRALLPGRGLVVGAGARDACPHRASGARRGLRSPVLAAGIPRGRGTRPRIVRMSAAEPAQETATAAPIAATEPPPCRTGCGRPAPARAIPARVRVAAGADAGSRWAPACCSGRSSATIQEQLARQSADAGSNAVEARAMARQAQDLARDVAGRQAVTDTRVSEVALQRTQLEELMQSLSRSRDENLVVDIEPACAWRSSRPSSPAAPSRCWRRCAPPTSASSRAARAAAGARAGRRSRATSSG